MRLKDKISIVTGGARGQGRSHCLALAKEGSHIVIADLAKNLPGHMYNMSSEEQLNQVVEEVKKIQSTFWSLEL